MDSTVFWERFKALLKQRGLTQEAACSAAGIPVGTMRGWITHGRLPDAELAVRLAAILETTAEYLVTGESSAPRPDVSGIISDLESAMRKVREL